MRVLGQAWILLGVVAVLAHGCASPLSGKQPRSPASLGMLASAEASAVRPPDGDRDLPDEDLMEMPLRPLEPSGSAVAIGDHSAAAALGPKMLAAESAPTQRPLAGKKVSLPRAHAVRPVAVQVASEPEEPLPQPPAVVDSPSLERIATPEPAAEDRFKPQAATEEFDRFQRQIADVPVDIRPSAGVLPENQGAAKFAAEPLIDETFPSDEPADVFCAYTPWTICYRPLYFEDIALERYGKNVGYLQTGLSGVRFFTSVAALPYKMTRRPPRSCECSNGFSRPGDCPLPGYGTRRFAWDAALVEAAVVTGFVYIIP